MPPLDTLPRRRIVLDSTGKPVEEVSEEGLQEAIADYFAANPVQGDGGPVPDPGDLTLSFENALI